MQVNHRHGTYASCCYFHYLFIFFYCFFSVFRFFPQLLYLQWVEDDGSSIISSWLASGRKTLNLLSLDLGDFQGEESVIILKYCPRETCSTSTGSGQEILFCFLPPSGFHQSFTPKDKVHDYQVLILYPSGLCYYWVCFFEIVAKEEGP